MLTFVWKIFKNKKKDYITLLVILTLLMSFQFCFLTMYNSFTYLNLDVFVTLSINIIPCISLFITVFLIVFVVKYFIDNKKQEFSILLLSGRKPRDLFVYIITQFGILLLIAFILGMGIGICIMMLIQYTFDFLSLSYSPIYNLASVLFIYICFLFISIVFTLAVASKQFVLLDTNLSLHLSSKSSSVFHTIPIKFSANSKKKKLPIFSVIMSIVIIYITVIQIIQIMNPNISLSHLMMSFTLSLVGIVSISDSIIPLLYDILHDHFLLKHSVILQGLALFISFSKTLKSLLNMNACILPTLLFMLFFAEQNSIAQVILVPSFIMNVIMIVLCFILRFSIYNKQQLSSLSVFNAIGYSPKHLFKISLFKNFIFILFGLLIPFLLLYQLFTKSMNEGYLNNQLGLFLIIFYVVIYLALVIYIMINERLSQKEVSRHVKYLNRG